MNKRINLFVVFLGLALLAAASVSAKADTVMIATFNTGQDTNAATGQDNHWRIVVYSPVTIVNTDSTPFGSYATPYNAYLVNVPFNSAWFPNGTDANNKSYQWIAPSAEQNSNGEYAGTFDYQYDFSNQLEGLQLSSSTVTVSFDVAADNNFMVTSGTDASILVEGYQPTTITNYNNWTTITFTLEITQGSVFDIFVDNYNDSQTKASNPSGLLVKNLTITATTVPEPSAAALIPMGIGLMVLAMSRHRRIAKISC